MQQYLPYLDWINTQADKLESTLMQWSAINTGTFNLAGLKEQREALHKAFTVLDAETFLLPVLPLSGIDSRGQRVEVPLAPCMRWIKRPQAASQVLLVGHMDTVFAVNSNFQQPAKITSNKIQGPGVTDMKGGLLVMLYALQAFERSPFAEKLGWQVFINADEEIGSPGSAPFLAEAAPRYQTGLVFEPSLDESGTLASHRKGSGNFTVVVQGRAAHAGRAITEGRNAIVSIADLITQIDALNGQRSEVTFNVGVVEGGQGLNVVPDLAITRFNVRIKAIEDEAWVLEKINTLLAKINQREGFNASVHGGFSRKPKLQDAKMQKLCDYVTQTGTLLGLSVQWQMSGGVCDGNNLAAAGLATIDTLGVRGGNIHNENEYICLESLVERARLTALLLMRMASE